MNSLNDDLGLAAVGAVSVYDQYMLSSSSTR